MFNDVHYIDKAEDNLNDSIDNSGTEIDDYFNKLNVKRMKIRMMNTKIIINKLLKVIKV